MSMYKLSTVLLKLFADRLMLLQLYISVFKKKVKRVQFRPNIMHLSTKSQRLNARWSLNMN